MVNWKLPIKEKKYLNSLLEKNDLNKALEFIRFLAESVTANREYASYILSSSELDNFCQEIEFKDKENYKNYPKKK
jgi:hypothetical protein